MLLIDTMSHSEKFIDEALTRIVHSRVWAYKFVWWIYYGLFVLFILGLDCCVFLHNYVFDLSARVQLLTTVKTRLEVQNFIVLSDWVGRCSAQSLT